MSSRKATTTSTANYSDLIDRLGKEIAEDDAVVIGAGAGLSAAAGLTYSGERFENHFADFITKYHYRDMYSATFYPYETPEEYWAYMSRHILLNRYTENGGPVYADLLKLVQDKNYFVITTNVDHCFQNAGFDKLRLFYTQGDYGLWQCSKPCHQKTYGNEDAVRCMARQQSDLKIPTELIPHCPVCGCSMGMNLRCDDTFVEDEGWHRASERYAAFIRKYNRGRILFLELGVGGNTPVIIKYPFWKMAYQNPEGTYACVNLGGAVAPQEIRKRSICIDADIGQVIKDLNSNLN